MADREIGNGPVTGTTTDGFYTFKHAADGYWIVGASHVDVVGELSPVEYVDYCVPTELPNARRRALRAARKALKESN